MGSESGWGEGQEEGSGWGGRRSCWGGREGGEQLGRWGSGLGRGRRRGQLGEEGAAGEGQEEGVAEEEREQLGRGSNWGEGTAGGGGAIRGGGGVAWEGWEEEERRWGRREQLGGGGGAATGGGRRLGEGVGGGQGGGSRGLCLRLGLAWFRPRAPSHHMRLPFCYARPQGIMPSGFCYGASRASSTWPLLAVHGPHVPAPSYAVSAHLALKG